MHIYIYIYTHICILIYIYICTYEQHNYAKEYPWNPLGELAGGLLRAARGVRKGTTWGITIVIVIISSSSSTIIMIIMIIMFITVINVV